jgi:hypothetical protein
MATRTSAVHESPAAAGSWAYDNSNSLANSCKCLNSDGYNPDTRSRDTAARYSPRAVRNPLRHRRNYRARSNGALASAKKRTCVYRDYS